jgi:hypothetical protein
MKRLLLGILGAVVVASTLAFASMGGWAVVTVMKIPDAWIAGKPLQLAWQVRQHGVTRLEGLRPTRDKDIAPLIAFINAERRVTKR